MCTMVVPPLMSLVSFKTIKLLSIIFTGKSEYTLWFKAFILEGHEWQAYWNPRTLSVLL